MNEEIIKQQKKENKEEDMGMGSPQTLIVKKEKKEKKAAASFLIASILLSIVFGGIAGFFSSEISNKGLRGAVEQVILPQDLADGTVSQDQKGISRLSLVEEESATIQVVDKAAPAVVSIIITKDVPKLDSFSTNPFFNDPFFNPFGFNVPQKEARPETERREIGGGTGFIVSSDGYIVTNRHVVEDLAADYTVVMNDGSRIEAEVLARDTLMDIAILRVARTNLPVVDLGDSDNLKIGQTVIAIGNSLGEFRNTVSKGIISGLKRNVSAGDGMGRSELLQEVIQTDAAINPGNSGGPILNLGGQAVGVNVAMARGAENIGFAIPINEVKKIYTSVRETGEIIRPFLGVRYMIINEAVMRQNNLPVNYGALIVRGSANSELAVVPGSPANKAGLEEGDVILEVDGKQINQENDLAQMIKRLDVGDFVELKVLSKGEEKSLRVELEAAN